jgi:hypothetical protein
MCRRPPCDRRADVICRILQRQTSGASIRATAVRRGQKDLFYLAQRIFGNWRTALEAAGLDAESISRRRAWTAERVIQAIHALHAQGVSLNYGSVLKVDQGLIQGAFKVLGSWSQTLAAAGYDPASVRWRRLPWTKSELIACIQQRAAAGVPLVESRLLPASTRFAVKRLFGSFVAALRIAGVLYRKPPRWSRAVVLAAIRDRHAAGQPVHCTSVIASQRTLYDAARYYCGNWNQALRAAGFDPSHVRRKPPPWKPKDVIAELRRRAQNNPPAPTISCMQPVSLVRACITFFGSLESAAAAARVDPSKIACRRGAGRRRRRYRGGGQENAPAQ